MSTSSRVIKNTGYLYIKMCITGFVTLYSTRLVFGALGASDYGIFSVIGGAIAMLGFLNSTLANATQRFMSYAEGAGDLQYKRQIFNVSLVLHVLIAIITAIVLITAMIPLFNGIFNLEPNRIFAAKIVYFCLIFSTVLTIINVPYDAVMNAHENMLYYSIIGVFEAILKLAVAFLCVYTCKDKLVLYGVLMACIPLITLSIMKVYCHRKYEECVISPKKYWNSSIVKQIFDFFGWNFLTAISSLFSVQGVGIVLNYFYGTKLNAAQGIAGQVNGISSHFSGNMIKAINPVVAKSAGAHNTDTMHKATLSGSKFSTIITLFLGIPISIEAHYILKIWLTNVPEWAVTFVFLQMVNGIIVQMGSVASTAVYAQGDIRAYAIWKSILNVLPLLATWMAFSLGGSPIWLYLPMIVFWGIAGDMCIVHYAKVKCGLKVGDFTYKVVFPIIFTALFMIVFGSVPVLLMEPSFIRLVLTSLMTTIGLILAGWFFAITNEEKKMLIGFVKQIIKKNK